MFENNIITGMALAIFSLMIVMVVTSVVPVLILDMLRVPRKYSVKFVGIFALLGFFIWIYLMFYMNFYQLFL
ncbi:hypothetical protein [Cytobacillus horneckiae]|uniref:hypothetical protein n=1 Tax=Cytobacillus horneckiae TaxID=549687 RepID=UPI003D25B036